MVSMRSLAVALVGALAACSFSPPTATSGDGGLPFDATATGADAIVVPVVDATPPLDASRICIGTGIVQVCEFAPPPGPLVINANTTIDTTSDPRCAAELPPSIVGPACLIWASSIEIAGDINVVGDRPLILAAVDSITSAGAIDASSQQGVRTGPGAVDPVLACEFARLPADDVGGGGGAAGGSFRGLGGPGGLGDQNNNNGDDGSADGGLAAPSIVPTVLRAGCNGGQGGRGYAGDAGVGGAAGAGGGAIALLAGEQISLGGPILAGGAGGAGGGRGSGGGGGGGAGGMIVIDAVTTTTASNVVANGGAGGEGATYLTSDNQNHDGTNGANGLPSTMAAPGGASVNDLRSGGFDAGGNGGNGSAQAVLDGVTGVNGNLGGGGGGGGAGFIFVYGNVAGGGLLSPGNSAPI